MKDVKDLIEFLIGKSNVLVTMILVGIVVAIIQWLGWLAIERPYVYFVYLVYLVSLAAASFLAVGAASAVGSRAKSKLLARFDASEADARALRNFEHISQEHARILHWIVKVHGRRLSLDPWKVHEEMEAHGFLYFDDPKTRYQDTTYMTVRECIFEKVSAEGYEWPWRFKIGNHPPWINPNY